MALAQAHEIDAILVTELSRWGRSTQDLVQTVDDLHSWKVSVLAQTGLSFDLSTASGKLMRTIMAGIAESERDLIRERVKSGLATAKAKGVALGRQLGQRPSDKKAEKVLSLARRGSVLSPDRPQRGTQQEHRHGDHPTGGCCLGPGGSAALEQSPSISVYLAPYTNACKFRSVRPHVAAQ
jgi:Resolvase, N terminal domain